MDRLAKNLFQTFAAKIKGKTIGLVMLLEAFFLYSLAAHVLLKRKMLYIKKYVGT